MIDIFTLLYISIAYVPDGKPYGLAIEAMFAILTLTNFINCDFKKARKKAQWYCLCIYTILNAFFLTWIDDAVPFFQIICPIEIFLFLLIYCYSYYRSYEVGTDEYNPEDTFIIFKHPKNFRDYFVSFVFKPVSSVSVVIAGERYGFKKGNLFDRYKFKIKDNYSLIKFVPPKEAITMLEKFRGERWKFSNNCCHFVQKLFPSHKFKWIDSIPSHMASTILKIR